MKCTYFQQSHCRSCSLLELSYDQTIIEKENDLKNLFPDHLEKIESSVKLKQGAESSRSKAKFAVFNEDGQLQFGFYTAEAQFKKLDLCPLHVKGINELLPLLKEILTKYKIPAYEITQKSGELKYILITKGSEEFLVRFVIRSKESLDRLRKAAIELQAREPKIKVITANLQPIHQAIIEGDEEIVLTTEQIMIHQFDEFKLALGARSFFQVTPEMAKTLYHSLAEKLKYIKPKTMLDLYCGVGAFSFYASRWCEKVIGVEISSEAIKCAHQSISLNSKHGKIDFFSMDAESFVKKNNQQPVEVILVNPPRRGLNSSIIENMIKINPGTIYYSSCNAHSLKRDYEELAQKYEIMSLQLFDMFPYTNHYETLMCLKRK